MPRLILLVIVVAVGYWLYKNSAGGLFGSRADDAGRPPVERARAAARAIENRQAEADRLGREEPTPREAGRVHENMTSSEVRTLLGAPDEVTSSTSETGAPRETWHYRSVGKTVVFENGVAVRVE